MRSWIATAALAALLVGCGAARENGAAATAATAPAASPVDESVLIAADRADGTEDRVVEKCAVCGLAMDGSPELAASHRGYTFHLCSAECKESFERDPERLLGRLNRS